jgi:hypothetical protein
MSNGTEAAEQLAKQINKLSRAATPQVQRVGPLLQRALLRLLGTADDKAHVAVSQYLKASRRAHLHRDAVTLQQLEQAETVLSKRLTGLGGEEEELLRKELAQRRLALLEDPGELADRAARAEAAAAKRLAGRARIEGIDLGATLIQRRFLDGVAALNRRFMAAVAKLAEHERALVRAYQKLRAVIGVQWSEGWDEVFEYLRRHAGKIGDRAKQLAAAEQALQAARKAADPKLIQQAEAAVAAAKKSLRGYHSKVKGLLGEAYIQRWKGWRLMREGYLEEAERAAASLGHGWQVRHVAGGVRLDGKEAWDEVILLVREGAPGRPAEAKLFLAAQHKVEKHISSLGQVEEDFLREMASPKATKLPFLTVERQGALEGAYVLTSLPAGQTTHRLVFNASGGEVASEAVERLGKLGIQVHQVNVDVNVAEMDAAAEALMKAVAETVN